MATTTVPSLLPPNDQIGLITVYTEHHTGTSTEVSGYDLSYYSIPFFIWFVFGMVSIFIMNRLTIEFIKRWRRQP